MTRSANDCQEDSKVVESPFERTDDEMSANEYQEDTKVVESPI